MAVSAAESSRRCAGCCTCCCLLVASRAKRQTNSCSLCTNCHSTAAAARCALPMACMSGRRSGWRLQEGSRSKGRLQDRRWAHRVSPDENPCCTSLLTPLPLQRHSPDAIERRSPLTLAADTGLFKKGGGAGGAAGAGGFKKGAGFKAAGAVGGVGKKFGKKGGFVKKFGGGMCSCSAH